MLPKNTFFFGISILLKDELLADLNT